MKSLLSVVLLALLCAGCQTTARDTRPVNSDDVNRNITLPRNLPNVWYRPDVGPAGQSPPIVNGTIMVGTDAILYNGEEGTTLNIPTRAIRSVVWRVMKSDLVNQWAVVIWLQDGAEQLVGFCAADGYRYDTSNKELYSAIVMAWQGQQKR